MLAQNPVSKLSKLVTRCVFLARTGYWHTGERCCPDFADENFRNHLKVYRFAAQFCGARRVLDVGCGTGYGTAHLATSAKKVIGIDNSRQALRYARTHFRIPNLQFARMNAECLRFADHSFDLIISTENFEHLHNQRANLQEMARILATDGMLLLATPNPEMFVGVPNRYHTHETAYEELAHLVSEFFSEWVVSENLLAPSTEEGIRSREERRRVGAFGIDLTTNPVLWGEPIDPTWLSNTHSFVLLARCPRQRPQ
jgi:ubiquinone/menaquinone biosynthesis C-methylase UbiE